MADHPAPKQNLQYLLFGSCSIGVVGSIIRTPASVSNSSIFGKDALETVSPSGHYISNGSLLAAR